MGCDTVVNEVIGLDDKVFQSILNKESLWTNFKVFFSLLSQIYLTLISATL